MATSSNDATRQPRKLTKAQAGSKGGTRTRDIYGLSHFSRIGKLGGAKGRVGALGGATGKGNGKTRTRNRQAGG